MALFNVGPYARLWISMTIWLQVDNPSVLRVLQLREMAETLQNNTKYSIMNQKVKRCHDLMSHQEVINSFLSVASINSIAFYWSVYLCDKKKTGVVGAENTVFIKIAAIIRTEWNGDVQQRCQIPQIV